MVAHCSFLIAQTQINRWRSRELLYCAKALYKSFIFRQFMCRVSVLPVIVCMHRLPSAGMFVCARSWRDKRMQYGCMVGAATQRAAPVHAESVNISIEFQWCIRVSWKGWFCAMNWIIFSQYVCRKFGDWTTTIYVRSLCDVNRVKWWWWWWHLTYVVPVVSHNSARSSTNRHYVNNIEILMRPEIISQSVCVHQIHKGVISSNWSGVQSTERGNTHTYGHTHMLTWCGIWTSERVYDMRRTSTTKGMKSAVDCVLLWDIYFAVHLRACWEMPRRHVLSIGRFYVQHRKTAAYGNDYRFLRYEFVNEYVIMPFRRIKSERVIRIRGKTVKRISMREKKRRIITFFSISAAMDEHRKDEWNTELEFYLWITSRALDHRSMAAGEHDENRNDEYFQNEK